MTKSGAMKKFVANNYKIEKATPKR